LFNQLKYRDKKLSGVFVAFFVRAQAPTASAATATSIKHHHNTTTTVAAHEGDSALFAQLRIRGGHCRRHGKTNARWSRRRECKTKTHVGSKRRKKASVSRL
jgi:hypothetical protein